MYPSFKAVVATEMFLQALGTQEHIGSHLHLVQNLFSSVDHAGTHLDIILAAFFTFIVDFVSLFE